MPTRSADKERKQPASRTSSTTRADARAAGAGTVADVTVGDVGAADLAVQAFRHAAWGLAVADAHDHTLVTANEAHCTLLGLPLEQLVGRSVFESYRPADRSAIQRALAAADESGAARCEVSLQCADGSEHPVEMHVRSIRDSRGEVRWRTSSVRSIRLRLMSQRENEELYRRMRSLSRRLESVQESERRHVANVLHEGLMQSLTGLNLGLERLKRDIGAGPANAGELLKLVDALQREVRDATQSARVTASEFLPPGLEHLGLWPVLERHVATWSAAARVPATVAFGSVAALPHEVALAGFRAVDECLRNVALHASAQELQVSSRRDGRNVEILVEDDGIGIGPGDLDKPGALGLLGATERVLMVGGELRVQRRVPHGTRVAVRLPLSRAKARN